MDEVTAMREKTERNKRVQARYDELRKHKGHYESMFRVVREEVEAEIELMQRAIESLNKEACTSMAGLSNEIERLRAALLDVVQCDSRLDLTPYDYMHNNDDVRAVMLKARVLSVFKPLCPNLNPPVS